MTQANTRKNNSQIKIAIISGCFLLIGSAIPSMWNFFVGENQYKSDSQLSNAVTGSWYGIFTQEGRTSGKIDTIIVDISLIANRKGTVTGSASFSYENKHTTVALDGGTFKNRVLKIDYFNEDPAKDQFGTVLLKYSSDGRYLDGLFIGYSPTREKIIPGAARLEKK